MLKLAPKREYVVLQRQTAQQDASGQLLDVWSTLREEWATVLPALGPEYMNASGERARITHRLRVWYGSGVRPRDRVLYGTRVLDIESVVDADNRHLELELACTEVI